MRSLTERNNDVALNRKEQQWLLWSLTPVALRHLLLEGENCDVIPSAAIQTVKASLGGLTFIVTVAGERPGQLALCLESVRTWHPDASLVVMSDTGTHSEYKAITKRYLGRYVEGNGLQSIAGDALWWERICLEVLRDSGNCILKVGPSSRVCRFAALLWATYSAQRVQEQAMATFNQHAWASAGNSRRRSYRAGSLGVTVIWIRKTGCLGHSGKILSAHV
jgi:hypothetical protein